MMNKTKIDWPWKPLYTWNPVIGCQHGCSYCYARKMSNRFKMIPKWEEPKFFTQRIQQPIGKKSMNIFIGSMCDLFGEWVDSNWIHSILEICEWCKQHTFFFLTKNPTRYAEFNFPDNCWIGATITCPDDFDKYQFDKESFIKKPNKTFLSLEPLLGNFEGINFSGLDLVIVGAMTGHGAIPPKKEWIESIEHSNIYYKNNIKKYL